jgi:hypothetical protein
MKKASEIQVGDKVRIFFNGNWQAGLTVSVICVNPYYGWIGFRSTEWGKDNSFNWRGWFNPSDMIETISEQSLALEVLAVS